MINTKTLLDYGTGRSGGARGAPPQIFAVDKAKAAGRRGADSVEDDRGADDLPASGQQYIVFATGTGDNTSLVALTLPSPGGRGGGAGPGGR